MQIRIFLIVCFAFIATFSFAQSGDLIIKGTAPDLYVIHTVAPKENWYSLARLFNGTPKDIASYNGITIDKPLNIGQEVKIPLRIANFSQNGKKAADEVLVPVYHTIQDKEWLYRVSTNFNKVPVETLEKWNGVKNDELKAGMNLIVGFLKVKKDQSALASMAATPGQPTKLPVAAEPVAKSEATDPIVKKESAASTTDTKPVEEKKVATESRPAPATTPVYTSTSNATGGYFRNMYAEAGKSAAGTGGIFKSTSGWQDGKFYALMNNVPVGTIIRVINPLNNKTIYAKVLGELPDMRESIGLTVRISDAAAAELAVGEGRFTVSVRY